MATRSNYWSNSRFAKWITNTFGGHPQIQSGTMAEWREWKRASKEKNPYIYWFTEEFLDRAQDVVYWPLDKYDDIRVYISNRFFDKIHYLPTNLEPGKYYEVKTRLLHGLFETLVDFIEIEKAWMHVVWDKKAMKDYFPWHVRIRSLRYKHYRNPAAGLAHLKWEISLGEESPYQSKAAREQLDLYNWWKNVRPARVDPFDKSGLSAFYNKKRNDGLGILDPESESDKKEHSRMMKLCDKIEKEYNDEDEEMMIRLIRLRKSLWT